MSYSDTAYGRHYWTELDNPPEPARSHRRALVLTALMVGLVIAAICFRKGYSA